MVQIVVVRRGGGGTLRFLSGGTSTAAVPLELLSSSSSTRPSLLAAAGGGTAALAEAESIMTALFCEMWALIGDWRERCVDACHGEELQREAVGEQGRKNTHEWLGQKSSRRSRVMVELIQGATGS